MPKRGLCVAGSAHRAIVRNYATHPLQLDPFDGTTLAVYFGTSIGNFSPEEARLILRDLRVQLQTGDALLLGTDMVKDEPTLLAAYDDSDGITAAFNLNILRRLNRELRANFDAGRFRHRVLWNSTESRIEMRLESTQEQDVGIEDADLDLHFERGETIHTENSYKFTDPGIQNLLGEAGLRREGHGKTIVVGTPSRLRASDNAWDHAAIAIENRQSLGVSCPDSPVAINSSEPIPKYRRYHRPIVHLPCFCSDDYVDRERSLGARTAQDGSGYVHCA